MYSHYPIESTLMILRRIQFVTDQEYDVHWVRGMWR